MGCDHVLRDGLCTCCRKVSIILLPTFIINIVGFCHFDIVGHYSSFMNHLSFGNRFFRQFIAFFATHQMGMALFRFLGAILKTMVVANTFGIFVLLIIFIFGGFVIRRSKYVVIHFLFL